MHCVVTDEEEEKWNLLEENRMLKEERTCKVCMDAEVNTVFLPCGHLVCCALCAQQQHFCSICQKCISRNVRVVRVSNFP